MPTNLKWGSIGRYNLTEHIASGGMAEVYRAFFEGAEGFVKEVAIKRNKRRRSERKGC